MSTILRNIGSHSVSGAMGFEMKIQPGQHRINFPDLELLRNKRIKHIDVCDELTDVPSQLPLVSTPQITSNNIAITLRKKNTQINNIERLPLIELATSLRRGNRLLFDDVFDFPASYIELPYNANVDVLPITTTSSIYFVVWYDEPFVANVVNPRDERKISYFELTLNNSRTYFSENRTLFRKKFQSIMLTFPQITAENNAGINASTAYKSYITLQRKNLQFFQGVPVYLFYQTVTAYMLNIQNVMFDFTNSFVDVVNMDWQNELGKTVFFNCIVVD